MDAFSPMLRGSIMLGALLALATFAPGALAVTYSVNISPKLHDLDVKIEPVPSDGILVVKLTNKTDKEIRCDLRYDAAPQPLYRNTTYVDPGKTEQSVFRAKRKWFTVNVDVECKTAQK